MICGHIDGYQILWPDISNGYRVTAEQKIDVQELILMADGKYVALTVLDIGNRFVNAGEIVEFPSKIAKILLKKQAIKPYKQLIKKEVKNGTDN